MTPVRTLVLFTFGWLVMTAVAILVIRGQWSPVYDEGGNGCRSLTDASRERREELGLPFAIVLGGWTLLFAGLSCAGAAREFPPGGVRAAFVAGCVPGTLGAVAVTVTAVGTAGNLEWLVVTVLAAIALLFSAALSAGSAKLSSPDTRPDPEFWAWSASWGGIAVMVLIGSALMAAFIGADEVPIC